MKDGRIGNDLSQNGRIPGGEVVWQIITCKRRIENENKGHVTTLTSVLEKNQRRLIP